MQGFGRTRDFLSALLFVAIGAVGLWYAAGYPITVATASTHLVGPLTHEAAAYDPVNDFAHIGMIGETPHAMVISPGVQAESVQDYALTNPGELNFGSAGTGPTTHLAGLMFLAATGADMEHVPYDSYAAATTALMGDEIQVLFGSMSAVLAQIRAGSITALAVGTTVRSPELADVPTMQEAGVEGYRASLWLGLAAPAGTPDDFIAILADTLNDSLQDPAVAEQLASNGAEPSPMTPEEFRQLIID